MMLIDSHVHLWDATRFPLAWTRGLGYLDHSHDSAAYRQEADGLGIQRSIVIEVDVAEHDRRAEADDQVLRCASARDGILAAIPCLDPRDLHFLDNVRELSVFPMIRGFRWIARQALAAQELTTSPLVRQHLQDLGKRGLTFDLNVPMSHFTMLPLLARACPATRFILDHCGYADPEAFSKRPRRMPTHDAVSWLRTMEELAGLPNVCCKVSGLANRLPLGACTPEAIAPIIDHARTVFGASRLLFGSDWPVVGPPGALTSWITALRSIASGWAPSEQEDLFGNAARRWYALDPLL